MTAPNGTWTADFKGQFKTRNGVYCYPLTVVDGFSRYLLACHGLLSTAIATARPIFLHLFQEYGLPRIIPNRQRRALRDHGARATIHIVRLVDSAGHPPRVDRARVPAAERAP